MSTFQSGVDSEPQRRVLPDAGAVVCARQPGLVLGSAAVDGIDEQDAEQDPRGARDTGDAVEPGTGRHSGRHGCHRLRLTDAADVRLGNCCNIDNRFQTDGLSVLRLISSDADGWLTCSCGSSVAKFVLLL